MREHLLALAFAGTALLAAAGWVAGLSYAGALHARAGDRLIAVFPTQLHAARVATAIGAAPARRFEPLGVANAWLVEASAEGLARNLERQGALAVFQANGPLHFALGCGAFP